VLEGEVYGWRGGTGERGIQQTYCCDLNEVIISFLFVLLAKPVRAKMKT